MKRFLGFMGAALVAAMCSTASATFVINEIDSDTPGSDADEFVELKGAPFESGNGQTLVFYDGTATGIKVYRIIDLSGLTADANGFLLIADDWIPGTDLIQPNGFIQNGEDALALYTAAADTFTTGAAPTTANLSEVIVYEANAQTNRDWSAFGTPTIYNEGAGSSVTIHGLSRIPDGPTGNWQVAALTPKAPNSVEKVSITDFFLPRMNQVTALSPTTGSVTIRNVGLTPMTITGVELATTSSAVFSIIAAPFQLPVTLGINETTSVSLQFLETNASVNKTYTGELRVLTSNASYPVFSNVFSTELVRATVTAPVGAVKVNEISYTGGFDYNRDGTTFNQGDEFVELFNTTNAPILIEGWEQRSIDFDQPNFHSFVFPAGTTIPANGYVTVFTSGSPKGFTPSTVFTYGVPRLRNTGAFVNINDATKLIDGVAYLAAEDIPDADAYKNAGVAAAGGDSLGRLPNGSDTFATFDKDDTDVSNDPTPNSANGGTANVSDWAIF